MGKLRVEQVCPDTLLDATGVLAGWLLLLTPIANPDLPWHLSAGRRIFEQHSLPAVDWLSWSKPGAPWTDFEWGAQLLYHAVWSVGGVPALFVLKAVVLAGLFSVFFLVLKTLAIPAPWRGAAAAALGAALSLSADLRPDHFSLLFFAVELLFVESVRTGALSGGNLRRWAAAHVVLYALWANLHPGFVMGGALLVLYAVGEPRLRKTFLMCAAAGAVGTLFNPHGPGVYTLLWVHARDMKLLAPLIMEWRPSDPRLVLHRPFFLIVLFCAAAMTRERRVRPPHLLAALFFGAMAASHSRHIPYFAIAALPAAALALLSAPPLPSWKRNAALACGLGLWGAFAWGRLDDGLGRRVADMRFYPEGLSSYLEDEAEDLGGLKLFHPMAWGGYLGWRLAPDYKVFWDGRYIFADLLPGALAAPRSAPDWTRYMKEQGFEMVALERGRLGTIPFRPPGSVPISRPTERLYMNPGEWALVYWDSQALLFVRRDKADPDWLEEHEFRILFPDDQPFLLGEVKAGRLPREAVSEEVRRYLESDADDPEKARWDAFLGTL